MVNMSKRRNSRKRKNSNIKKLKFINKILKILIIIFTIILVYSINKTKFKMVEMEEPNDDFSGINIKNVNVLTAAFSGDLE